ncbi:phycobilisome linker polypeptide CpcG2 [Nostoc carneum NIES-2107]|nr:phycobilisome linker polypeptide CpcG2 [Nostoc carneum NIES-2107]
MSANSIKVFIMSIPLLEYAPSSQNQRVVSFEIPGDEQPRIYTTENLPSPTEMDVLISAAYRQIFHEQQMLSSNRQVALESQLRTGMITVREFIRGLVLSDSFRRLNYDVNNNYRFVEICVQRVLGRRIYSDREKFAWSTVLATKGIVALITELLNSEEYLNNFGDDTVPYQRRRILPQRSRGELPFERMARYDTDYRDKLPRRGYIPMNLQTFLRSRNRDLVLSIVGSGLGLIAILSLLTHLGLFPKMGPF